MINITFDKNGKGSVKKSISDGNALKFIQAHGYLETVSETDTNGVTTQVSNPETPPKAFVRILTVIFKSGIKTTEARTRRKVMEDQLKTDMEAITI